MGTNPGPARLGQSPGCPPHPIRHDGRKRKPPTAPVKTRRGEEKESQSIAYGASA